MHAESSNRRVAKNTLILYARMFITMAIGMWTSRIVLNALGFTDQGLYNLVGGFVGFLSLFTSSINGSFSRFLTYKIGRGDLEEVNKVFRNATTIQWLLALIIVLLAETVGLWFVCNKMIIPHDRMLAVQIVYQLSILLFVIELVSTTQCALVIAYEKMNIFAGVSVFSSIGKFTIAWVIAYSDTDRLVLYASLLMFLSLCVRIFYTIYCRHSFPFIKFGFSFNKEIFTPIFSFAAWNSIGSSAAILRSSGTSVLLNLFGGPIANTINSIAQTANSLAILFVNDFTTAYNPQIIKRYASGDYDNMIRFLHQCSKFSYCLLLVMAVPVMINVEPLLILWLKNIPEGTPIFARLIIICSLIECMCRPLITAKSATGEIRNYQVIVGGVLLLTIPISYAFLKSGFPIWFSYIAMIVTSSGAFIARMVMLKDSIPGWSSHTFLTTVVFQCIIATGVASSVPLFLHSFMPNNTGSVISQCVVGFFWCCLCVYYIGCNAGERKVLQGMLLKRLERFNISR